MDSRSHECIAYTFFTHDNAYRMACDPIEYNLRWRARCKQQHKSAMQNSWPKWTLYMCNNNIANRMRFRCCEFFPHLRIFFFSLVFDLFYDFQQTQRISQSGGGAATSIHQFCAHTYLIHGGNRNLHRIYIVQPLVYGQKVLSSV